MKVNVRKLKKAANNGGFKNFEEFKNRIKKNVKKFDKALGSYNWYKLYDDELLRAEWNVNSLTKFCNKEYFESKWFEFQKIVFERVKKIAEEKIKENGVDPEWQDNVKKFWDKASKKYYPSFETLFDGCFRYIPGEVVYVKMEYLYMFHEWTNCSIEWNEIENMLRDNMWMVGNCARVDKFKGVKAYSNTDELKANYDENKVIPEMVIATWAVGKKIITAEDVVRLIEQNKTFDEDACFNFEQVCERNNRFSNLYFMV